MCIRDSLSVIAAIMAFTWPDDVVVFVTEGFKVMTVLLPAIVSAILLKKPSSLAAVISVASGMLTWLFVKLLWIDQGHWGFVIGFTVATMLTVAIYKVEKAWGTKV